MRRLSALLLGSLVVVLGAFSARLGVPVAGGVGVFAVTGQRVATLLDLTEAGEVTVRWDTPGLAAEASLVRLQAGATVVARPVTVVR